MTTISIDERYVNTLSDITDIQTAVNIAIKRYIIDVITTQIAELSELNKQYHKKYEMDYNSFYNKISSDKEFINYLENIKGIKTWEADFSEWEFCNKGIEDWKQKLQTILTI